jgi:hypothetical protein
MKRSPEQWDFLNKFQNPKKTTDMSRKGWNLVNNCRLLGKLGHVFAY